MYWECNVCHNAFVCVCVRVRVRVRERLRERERGKSDMKARWLQLSLCAASPQHETPAPRNS